MSRPGNRLDVCIPDVLSVETDPFKLMAVLGYNTEQENLRIEPRHRATGGQTGCYLVVGYK